MSWSLGSWEDVKARLFGKPTFGGGNSLQSKPVDNAFIYEIDEPTRIIRFSFMPQSFNESKRANYQEIGILGRSEPIMGYSGSGPRLFNINLSLPVMGESPFTPDEVIQQVRLVQSWVYPDYSKPTLPSIPPALVFAVGKWLVQRCILLSYQTTYSAPWGRSPVSSVSGEVSAPTPTAEDDLMLLPGEAEGLRKANEGWTDKAFQSWLPDGATTGADSMIPFIIEMQLTLQEVTENSKYTPWDRNDVRDGINRGTWFL